MKPTKPFLSRRKFMGSLAAAALPLLQPKTAWPQQAQSPVLPLNTPGLDHLDIIVPDVEASARFYMQVFDTRLHAQPFQGSVRYFVLLGELPENRQVSYLAIGESGGRGTYIGHFCTSVFDYRRDSEAISEAMTEALRAEGFGEFPGATGIGGIFADPDGIEIQFLPAPDTLVTAAEPAELDLDDRGMVTPLGVDHVLLHVSDMERAVQYYRVLYGPEAGHRHDPERVWFEFPESRIVLEPAPYRYGGSPGIAHYCIRVAPFERETVAGRLSELGAEILAAPDEPGILRFRDPDGVTAELRSV